VGTVRARTAAIGRAVGVLLGGCAVVAVGSGGAGATVTSPITSPITSTVVSTITSTVTSTVGAKAGTTEYDLALGDSLAAGGGSPDGKGYVVDLFDHEKSHDRHLVLENLSCDGASTTSMMEGPGCSYATGTQLGDAEAFLQAHRGQVAFVTIDIGANDIDGCAEGTAIDLACVSAGLNAVTTNTLKIIAGLEAAAGSTPIVGMSYYDPFLADWLTGPSGEGVADQSESIAEQLNTILRDDFGTTRTADVDGAFKTTDFSPGGHYDGTKVPVNVGRICAWTNMCTEGDFHADDAGHAQIAEAYEKVLGPLLAADGEGRR
jgi:lysophospholipase L1-like esterase